MPHQTADLAALIGSRICHDLISPLGAIGNGVELLMMSGSAGAEVTLISESVVNANARIRFFRVAYGTAAPGQRIGRPEVVAILSDLGRGGRLVVDWQAEGDQPRREVKLAFLALQALECAMPYGGRITVAREGPRWRVAGTAAKMKIDPAPWSVLAGAGMAAGAGPAPEPPAEITAAQVQFALFPEELRRQGRRLRAEIGEGAITLLF